MKLNRPPLVLLSLKIILSFWILYHFLGILIMPSVQSIVVREKGWIFRPYLNQIGMNTTWNLFSPDPATAMFMKVRLAAGDPTQAEHELVLPEFGDSINWNPTKRRGLYMMRALLLDEQKVYGFLIPWYCRQYPGTREVYIQSIGTRIPTLDEARRERLYKISELRVHQVIKELHDSCPTSEGSGE